MHPIVLTWEHCAWACDHFWDRPERPHGAIQARPGWPRSQNVQLNQHVLEHLARVRGEVWEWQYPQAHVAGAGPAGPSVRHGEAHAATGRRA